MKKYILAAALVLVSTSALADRMVDGKSRYNEQSKATACASAKEEASRKRNADEQVDGYSPCDCDQNSNGLWSCTVDARLERRN